MKIKYTIKHVDDDCSYFDAESDVYVAGLDCIQGFLIDFQLLTDSSLCELEKSLMKDEFEWWGQEARINCFRDEVKIYTANSYNDEHAIIKRSQLKKIIVDWKTFLKNKQPMEREY